MKNKNVYAFDLAKSCKNCEHWKDINKRQEVKLPYSILPAVIFKFGFCFFEDLTTEKYTCENFKQKQGFKKENRTDKLGIYILSGVILYLAITLIIFTFLSIGK